MEETTKTRKAPAKPRKTAAKKTTAKAAAAPESTHANGAAAAAAPAPATNGAAPAKPISISRDEIAKLAHKYWAERGHQHGHEVEDWLRAERELRRRAS